MAFLIASLNLAAAYYTMVYIHHRLDKMWESRPNWYIEGNGRIMGNLWLRINDTAASLATVYFVASIVVFIIALVGTGMGLLR